MRSCRRRLAVSSRRSWRSTRGGGTWWDSHAEDRRRTSNVGWAAVELHAHVPKVGKSAGHWLFEGLLIVVSVALGFAVTQYRESRANRELASRVRKGLQSEVEHNLAILEPQIAMHKRWLQALNRSLDEPQPRKGQTARDVFIATWPDLSPDDIKPPFVAPGRGAWDAAL